MDQYLFRTPQYSDDLHTAFLVIPSSSSLIPFTYLKESTVFKFVDRTMARFRCQLRLCVKNRGRGCEAITVCLCPYPFTFHFSHPTPAPMSMMRMLWLLLRPPPNCSPTTTSMSRSAMPLPPQRLPCPMAPPPFHRLAPRRPIKVPLYLIALL